MTVGDHALKCEMDGYEKDQAVVATIRPEDIVVTTGKAPGKASNKMQMVVEELEFLGSFWKVELSNAALGGQSISANVSINDERSLDLEVGSKVNAELPAERIRVFAAEG